MLRGASTALVTDAIETRRPFPGTAGFAGELDDGRLVRDVLGREPLFIDEAEPDRWSFDPYDLDVPTSFPAGSVRDDGGIEQVWSIPNREPVDGSSTETALRDGLDRALETVSNSGLAIGFSGGVDSVLLAARADAPVYTVGFPESHDIEAARSAADVLGRDIDVIELDHDTLESLIPRVATAIDRTNAMDVQIALPLFALAEAVSADGFDRLLLGQGADELFGGYAKVEKAPEDPRVEADTVRGARDEVLRSLPDQIERDTLAIRAAGIEPETPYLHDAVVETALLLPKASIVDGDTRKVVLRRIASDFLPAELSRTPKKAMQYGTLVSREMDRLARQAGFKRRMDDHVTRYIESIVS